MTERAQSRSIQPMLRAAVLPLLLAVGSCTELFGPGVPREFALHTIDGQPLPLITGQGIDSHVEALGDTIRVDGSGFGVWSAAFLFGVGGPPTLVTYIDSIQFVPATTPVRVVRVKPCAEFEGQPLECFDGWQNHRLVVTPEGFELDHRYRGRLAFQQIRR